MEDDLETRDGFLREHRAPDLTAEVEDDGFEFPTRVGVRYRDFAALVKMSLIEEEWILNLIRIAIREMIDDRFSQPDYRERIRTAIARLHDADRPNPRTDN